MKRKPLSDYLALIKSANDQRDWAKAKRYGEIVLRKLSTLSRSHFEEYLLYCRIGSVYFSLKEYSQSLDTYYKAYLIATDHSFNPEHSAYASFGIGYNLLTIKNINQALLQFQKVEEYYRKYGNETSPMNKEIYCHTLICFGLAYLYKNKLELVQEIIEKKLPTYMPFLADKMVLLSCYKLKGQYLIARKEYNQARQSFQEYVKINEQKNLPNLALDGKAHLATIDLLEGKLDLAINKLEPLFKEARRLKFNSLICTIGLLLSKCYTLKEMPNKANSMERKIKPILNKLDITWFYETSRNFDEFYHRLQTVYKNTKSGPKPIPEVLTDTIKQHYETIPYKNIIIGQSSSMIEVYQLIEKIAPTNLPVLIQGETGTGKELVARAIHQNSLRKEKNWLALNCGAMPETLLENGLFGHIKGSFTDAREDTKGYIELASEGTLFLDEVADMSLAMQQKLLRVLEDKLVWRVGASKPIMVNTRFIFASNQNIEELVQKKLFREDLFYRINTIVITLPPLRDRKEDIPLLINHSLNKYSSRNRPSSFVPHFSPDAFGLLISYSWPGNVRELENEIKKICALYPDIKLMTEAMLSELIRNYKPDSTSTSGSLEELRNLAEKNIIIDALKKCQGNITETACLLKYDRANLYKKIKRLNIHITNEYNKENQ